MADNTSTNEATSLVATRIGLEVSKWTGLCDSSDPLFKSDQDLLNFCASAYSEWQSLNYSDRILQGGDEFYSTALMGTEGGEAFLPVIKLGLLINQLFFRLVKPQNSLVVHGPGIIAQASLFSENVYVPHNIHVYLAEKYLDTSELNNVSMIDYSDIYNQTNNYDFVCIIMGAASDREMLKAIMDSINPGGILVLSGSSNGGELYMNLEQSYAYQIHQEIINRGDFSLYNIPNFMAQTICIKNG